MNPLSVRLAIPLPLPAFAPQLAREFVAHFEQLSPQEAHEIAAHLPLAYYQKGSVLLAEGMTCSQCFFVLKGCLRHFFIKDGVEKTTQFFTEHQAAVFFTNYPHQRLSDSFLVCVEDTLVIVGDLASENKMYHEYPKLLQITRQLLEKDFGNVQDSLAYFVASSPEERYLHLLTTRPDLLHRVPQHQLASYLGVTPESLSRIRRRVMKNR